MNAQKDVGAKLAAFFAAPGALVVGDCYAKGAALARITSAAPGDWCVDMAVLDPGAAGGLARALRKDGFLVNRYGQVSLRVAVA